MRTYARVTFTGGSTATTPQKQEDEGFLMIGVLGRSTTSAYKAECMVWNANLHTHLLNRYLIYVLKSLSPDPAPGFLPVSVTAAYGCAAIHVSLQNKSRLCSPLAALYSPLGR